MKKDSVCFVDLDGTLIDVSEKFYQSYHTILTEKGFKPLEKDEYWHLKVSGVSEREIHLKSGAEIPDFTQIRKSHIETAAYQQYDHLIPGALDALEILSNHYLLILVTLRHNPKTLRDELVRLEIERYFALVLSKDPSSLKQKSLIKTKLIREAFPTFNWKVAVFIGDTEADILAGQEIGAFSIAVTSGLRTTAFLQELKPDRLVSDIEKVPPLLDLKT